MDWLTRSEFEKTELGDRLEIRVRTYTGLLPWVITAVGAPLAVYLFAKSGLLWGAVVAIAVGFSILKAIRNGNETCLTVYSNGFIAEGNVDRAFAKSVGVSVDDIYGIGFYSDAEGDSFGLFALSRFGRTCLIPSITESLCEQIKSAVEAKFPQMRFGQGPLIGILGSGPEIISLGLNRSSRSGS